MIKTIFLLYISNSLVSSEAFFINAKDIRKFFGLAQPTFYEIYKKEATENYRPSNYEERGQYLDNQHKKYENNINEKLPLEDYFRKPLTERVYEYDRDYSNKHETTKPYIKNSDKLCNQQQSQFRDRSKNSRDGHNPKVQPYSSGTVYKLHRVADKINEDKQSHAGRDDKQKDLVPSILVALPNLNPKNILNEHNYLKQTNDEKYYIKAILSSTPQPTYDEEYEQPENVF